VTEISAEYLKQSSLCFCLLAVEDALQKVIAMPLLPFDFETHCRSTIVLRKLQPSAQEWAALVDDVTLRGCVLLVATTCDRTARV
jgi:hypothetical protein